MQNKSRASFPFLLCLMLLLLKVAGDTRSARGADACPTTADEIATDRPDVTNSSLVVLCVAKYKLRRRPGLKETVAVFSPAV